MERKLQRVECQTLSVSELAAFLGISVSAAYEIFNSPGFPALRLSANGKRGTLRVLKSSLHDWLEAQQKKGALT